MERRTGIVETKPTKKDLRDASLAILKAFDRMHGGTGMSVNLYEAIGRLRWLLRNDYEDSRDNFDAATRTKDELVAIGRK